MFFTQSLNFSAHWGPFSETCDTAVGPRTGGGE